ncbi:PAAR domain-containing protein [uncultured Sphingomonas sp.]|uniref:PAAR domain-containing protein n=1 Tax=uncultured Sphingomonas sp. TaxID=158754 RepID=UPI0025E80BC7|nr:PAAR domain-containing protein [uncultured Sphingomonas sp.]
MTMMPAARVGDDIAHSNAGTGMLLGVLAGAAVGAVLVAATVATGGLALVAAAGAAAGMVSAGGLGGMYIGEASMGPACGKFVTGSPDVFINSKAALFTAGSFASCDKDSGAIPLATGSSSVFINTGMAGREGEKVGCSAVSVPKVSPNVFIGGDSAQDPRVEIHPEVPQWAVTGLQVLGIAGAIAALPFAIATVGVAATIGGAVVGAVGALGGAKAGRALGEALGLSEAGTRALETAGGFLGGMVGGAAGTKGTQWFNRNYQIQYNPNVLSMNGAGAFSIKPRVPPPSTKPHLPPSEGLSPNDPYILFNKTYKGARPQPRGQGPGGGRLQANHGLQGKWAKQNLSKYGYDDRLAPAETIETGATKPFEHTIISNRQNARAAARVAAGKGKWSSTLNEELNYTAQDYKAAGYSDATISKIMNQQYKMLDKLGVPYTLVAGY